MATKKLTPEESKALLDSLFALPNKVAKEKAPKKAAVKEEYSVPVQRNRAFKPAVCIIEVVHQICTTCGSQHSFVQSRRVRFEAVGKGELHTAYEIETVVPEKLPRQVDNTFTTTNICPTCIELTRDIDDFLCMLDAPIQGELFHG